ncbi:hypothetical protein RRG08_043455 [Elysia crispata]|uniref:Uncharacterized protein n=1 Tax=Elysia crispata TaxID=231223 RepID=A0AAE0XPP2_9GAST|nr:hypothetical protein RRG08_043455 [Elysia crispata]
MPRPQTLIQIQAAVQYGWYRSTSSTEKWQLQGNRTTTHGKCNPRKIDGFPTAYGLTVECRPSDHGKCGYLWSAGFLTTGH